jgi:16S rRNA (guanine(966)-N(2))-methyltransferase RsmD
MRIIAGEFRSRRIKSLPGTDLRPTPDRMRETLFNILAPELPGAIFLDAYAGTGAVGIEALSRGATRAIFLEKNKAAVALIAENLRSLGILSRASVISSPALRELGKHRADIVFLDPPYPLENEYAPALQLLARTSPKVVIAQHSVRFDPGDQSGSLARYRIVKQGDNALSFYRLPVQGADTAPADGI